MFSKMNLVASGEELTNIVKYLINNGHGNIIGENLSKSIMFEYLDDNITEKDAIKLVAKERNIAKSIVYKEYHNNK